VFADSEDLDACPLLRDRPQGRCSGVCIPVAVMGRTVGVMHSTSPPGRALDEPGVSMLQTLANQAGNRLGMLRVMAETQVQAATDGLTGLINRRSLENAMRVMRNDGIDFAFVMADLDHFKSLNDSNGHEAGDRALRVFSEALRREVRANDLACRYGGEEFALVFPGATAEVALEIVERIREALARATGRGDTSVFTASFGIACSTDVADLEDLVQRADKAMFIAKEAGRDRVCIDGNGIPESPSPLTALG
jgi:diguanylate cyclase (GGDEF)-like protein